ncbi:hypothetical protein AB0N05_36110 [Nocardia sp. NPDC051030]|uniref:hypothetical protein n=1 Tax=Nocardia sp. NPDC051030 TaxID=3155162 RepID=UPI003432D3E1
MSGVVEASRWAIAVAAGVTLLGTAACAESADVTHSTTLSTTLPGVKQAGFDPCKLLDDRDIMAAGGVGGVRNPDASPGCDFGAVALYFGNATWFGSGDRIGGIGDEAYYDLNLHQIAVRKGDTKVFISLKIPTAPGRSEVEVLSPLATKVANEL